LDKTEEDKEIMVRK